MEHYIDNVGAVYEHVEYSKCLNRLVPLVFVAKRAFLPICIFFIKKEIVAIYLVITQLHLCLILHLKPYVDTSLQKLELFNETIAFILFASLQRFKFEDEDPVMMYSYAWASITVIVLFMSTHISSNLIGYIKSTIQSCKDKNRKELDYAHRMEEQTIAHRQA